MDNNTDEIVLFSFLISNILQEQGKIYKVASFVVVR